MSVFTENNIAVKIEFFNTNPNSDLWHQMIEGVVRDETEDTITLETHEGDGVKPVIKIFYKHWIKSITVEPQAEGRNK